MVQNREHDKRSNRAGQGMSLIEAMVALVILLVVFAGLAPLLIMGVTSTTNDQHLVELVNVSRAKLEEIQSVPYDQVSTDASGGGAVGPGYFETDPLYNPAYDVATDFLLSDTVPLSFGVTATRTVTVEAIDDPADASGAADWDQVLDPNTGTVLDYKLVRVVTVATNPVNRLVLRQEFSTIISGVLDEEIDGASGQNDTGGVKPPKKGKDKKKDKKKKGKKGTDGKDAPPDKEKGKKGRKGKSDESND